MFDYWVLPKIPLEVLHNTYYFTFLKSEKFWNTFSLEVSDEAFWASGCSNKEKSTYLSIQG